MDNMWGKLLLFFVCSLLLATGVQAQVHGSNLLPYLQAERNEVALLTAQQNYLLQQGDTVGAFLVSSYIPDHQMQAAMLAQEISNRGGNPDAIQANVPTPYLGTREQILAYDSQSHASAVAMYEKLTGAGTMATQKLAASGLAGAEKHYGSLQVALGATQGGPNGVMNSLAFALQLEKTAILDIQSQSAQLRRLGDPTTADRLMSLIPAHQAQIAQLSSLYMQMGGDPNTVKTAVVSPLPTRDAILAHFRSSDIQMANTYAVVIAALPSTSPVQAAGIMGQRNALTAIAVLFGGPVAG